jgi:cation:H+ antiporter
MLYFGAEWLVRGSSQLALSMGIKPLIVGLTVVAMGTSSPEMMVSVIAAVNHTKDIALGNIIGSNIANLALVIGLSALIRPLPIQQNTAKKQMPFLLLASLLFYLLSLDGILDRRDGFVLFLDSCCSSPSCCEKLPATAAQTNSLPVRLKSPKPINPGGGCISG